MGYNYVIRSDDRQAAAKLAENIEYLKIRQEYMQAVNDYYQKNGTTKDCLGIDDNTAAELDARVNEYQKTPYPGKFFKDNFDEMNRLQANIDRVSNKRETLFKGWKYNNGEAVINLANNRLQLMFANVPSEEQRQELKQNGFKWAPTAKAWQRKLEPRTLATADKMDFVKPFDGHKPSELQPKVPQRNVPER